MKGICHSDHCRATVRVGKDNQKRRVSPGVVKINTSRSYTSKFEDWCPSCGHALEWVNENARVVPEYDEEDDSPDYYSEKIIDII